MPSVEISPLGDAAVLVTLGCALDQAVVSDVWSAYEAIRAGLSGSVRDIVPAYGSIAVHFDPAEAPLAAVMAGIRGALERPHAAPPVQPRTFDVRVSFEPESALDLNAVADETGLAPGELIAEFCAAIYRVAFLGFTAGFPYLLGLPERLKARRLPAPRTRVPAGSVAIAAGQCGIYPRETPGGWRVLGRTGLAIFDPSRSEPALFRPGDVVRFVRSDGALPE
jgi:KipI family sensor histidine kinase inhibitor